MIGESLELSRPFVAAEAWRLWTVHLVHWGPAHLLFNLIASVPPLMLLGRKNIRQVACWWVLCSPMLSALVFLDPSWTTLRGASGLVVGLWVFAALLNLNRPNRPFAAAMLVVVAAKLLAETFAGLSVANLANPPVVSSHWFGAMLGLAGALVVLAFQSAGGREVHGVPVADDLKGAFL